MTSRRLVAIAVIFLCSTFAWFVLATSLLARSGEFDEKLAQEVERSWGGPHVQVAPSAWIERPRTVQEQVADTAQDGSVTGKREVTRTVIDEAAAPLSSTRAEVQLALDQRQRGLLWYDTYTVAFHARYTFVNPDAVERPLVVHFMFPSQHTIYDDVVFRLDGKPVPMETDVSKGRKGRTTVAGGGVAHLEIAYRSRGLDTWAYGFAASGVVEVRNFEMSMTTTFGEIDFPPGTISASDKQPSADGWRLGWRFSNLVTGQQIGMDLPKRANPGPIAARITYFAPVSLLFFMTVMVMLGVISGESLHPMNYFFVAAAFFAFHLMLAYLVDHISLHLAFAIAAATSVGLVVSYLRTVAGMRRALGQAGLAQLIFLVLFSYAFFFEGYTGLTVTVGAVVTLFVLMQMTARVDWTAALTGRGLRTASDGR